MLPRDILEAFLWYNLDMIRIVCGGKKNTGPYQEIIAEYEKRMRKPYEISWQFMDEDKLLQFFEKWPFSGREFVICCDDRGENISSDEYFHLLDKAFTGGKDVVILIGGAYGFNDFVREKADFVWSFSKLVFPHMLARMMVVEQTYRAYEIMRGSHYHHA